MLALVNADDCRVISTRIGVIIAILFGKHKFQTDLLFFSSTSTWWNVHSIDDHRAEMAQNGISGTKRRLPT